MLTYAETEQVRICQHTSAYVSIRMLTYAETEQVRKFHGVKGAEKDLAGVRP
jgi:hypothetical protein